MFKNQVFVWLEHLTVNQRVLSSSLRGGAILDKRSFLTSFLFLPLFKTLLANIIDFISGVKMLLQLSKSKFSNFSVKMQPRIFCYTISLVDDFHTHIDLIARHTHATFFLCGSGTNVLIREESLLSFENEILSFCFKCLPLSIS